MVLKIISYFNQCINIFKKIDNANHILEWKSKGLSVEIIKKPLSTSANSLALEFYYIGNKTRVTFAGSCLKQDEVAFTHVEVDMSSSLYIDNKKKKLILGKGTIQGLENTLAAEKMFSINFEEYDKKYCLSLNYNEANNYLFVNGTEVFKLRAKYFGIVVTSLCLGNISK